MNVPNLFDDIPPSPAQELFQTLLQRPHVRIERIVSHGHASPPGFWYDQPQAEWVLLLSGAATFRFEGQEPVNLAPGSHLEIPAHRRHRVEWTQEAQPTIWLAVHFE